MDERDQKTEEEIVRRLLETAGPRPPIPQEDLDAISAAARSAWRTQVRRRAGAPAPIPISPISPRSRQPRRAFVLALAAVLALAIGLDWWWGSMRRAPTPSTVSWIEALSGPVLVQTAGGVTVRLHAETRLRFASAAVLELERGAIYVDTGGRRSSTAIVVRTPLGTVRDVGTRFAVEVVGPETLLVRVRDGEVLTEHQGRIDRTSAGQELMLRRDGTAERHAAAIHGPAWEWTLEAAPGFDVEGRSLRDFLDWVSRETGWQIVFADQGLAESAGTTVLHGSLGGLRPDRAPFAILPGAGLEGQLQDGRLVVRRLRVRAPR